MRLITDEKAREMGAPEDPADAELVLEDAESIWQFVNEQPFVEESTLRVHTERLGMTPERASAAINFLSSNGRLLQLKPGAMVPTTGLPALPPRADLLSKEDLKALARIYGVEGFSSMTKDGLLAALRGQATGVEIPETTPQENA